MHYMWQMIYTITFIIIFSDLFFSSNEVSANEERKTAHNNTKQNNNAEFGATFNVVYFLTSIIMSIIICIIYLWCKEKWRLIAIREGWYDTTEEIMMTNRNESQNQHITENMDDSSKKDDINDILNTSLDDIERKKNINPSMENYIDYISLESIPEHNQISKERFSNFNRSASISVINEKDKNRDKRMTKSVDESINKCKTEYLSVEYIPKYTLKRRSFNSDNGNQSNQSNSSNDVNSIKPTHNVLVHNPEEKEE